MNDKLKEAFQVGFQKEAASAGRLADMINSGMKSRMQRADDFLDEMGADTFRRAEPEDLISAEQIRKSDADLKDLVNQLNEVQSGPGTKPGIVAKKRYQDIINQSL